FSVPEIHDLRQRVKSLSAIGDFSTIGFTLNGLGEPREVQAGVVDGSYFDVMGLHPVLGRLIEPEDDGPKAAGVVVLTYRFRSEPREVQAGVVDGSYFDVMGLHPVLGRLIEPEDDGPKAAGVVVLTYRF